MRRPRGAFILPADGSGLGTSWGGRFADIITGKGPDMFIGHCNDTRVRGEDWGGYPYWSSPRPYNDASVGLPHTAKGRRPDLYRMDWRFHGTRDSLNNPWNSVRRYDPTTRRYEKWEWDVLDGPRNNRRRPIHKKWCHDPYHPWLAGHWQW